MSSRTHFLFVLPMLALGGCASTVDKENFLSSYNGLTLEEGVSNALVYEGDKSKFKDIDSVIIEDVELLLAPQKEGTKPVSEEDAVAMAQTFKQSLEDEFGSHYRLTDKKGKNTVAIRTALVQLKPHSPELYVLSYAPYSFVVQGGIWAATGNNPISGTTKFKGEMVESTTGEQLYAIVDKNTGKKFQVSAGLRKWGHSERSFRSWAKKMRVYLDEAKAEANAPVAGEESDAEAGAEGTEPKKDRPINRLFYNLGAGQQDSGE